MEVRFDWQCELDLRMVKVQFRRYWQSELTKGMGTKNGPAENRTPERTINASQDIYSDRQRNGGLRKLGLLDSFVLYND